MDESKASSPSKKVIIITIILVIISIVTYSIAFAPSPFQKEIKYYRNQGHIIDESETWSYFQTLDGVFKKVTKEQLHREVELINAWLTGYLGTKTLCRIFVDNDDMVLWISGVGLDPDERYVYWWSP